MSVAIARSASRITKRARCCRTVSGCLTEPKSTKTAMANHYLDAEVYAVAAADIIRALNIRKDETARVHQQIVNEEHSRSNWIRKREGSWL